MTRGNPNHDAHTGRFAAGDGAGEKDRKRAAAEALAVHVRSQRGADAHAPLKWKASTAPGHYNRTGHYVANGTDGRQYNIDSSESDWQVSHAGAHVGTGRTYADAKKIANDHHARP
jgi:hypothetical protein